MAEARQLSAQLTAAPAADPVDPIADGLIGDIARGVVDEHQDASLPTAGSKLIEARHRLERLGQARVDTTGTTGLPGVAGVAVVPRLGAATGV
jgi:hypothetical protein